MARRLNTSSKSSERPLQSSNTMSGCLKAKNASLSWSRVVRAWFVFEGLKAAVSIKPYPVTDGVGFDRAGRAHSLRPIGPWADAPAGVRKEKSKNSVISRSLSRRLFEITRKCLQLRKYDSLTEGGNTTIYLRPSACPADCGLLSESHSAAEQ